ncbi:MAG: hypothetical protein R3D71_09405 [Rickettsiales bacterium]
MKQITKSDTELFDFYNPAFIAGSGGLQEQSSEKLCFLQPDAAIKTA